MKTVSLEETITDLKEEVQDLARTIYEQKADLQELTWAIQGLTIQLKKEGD